MCFLCCCVKSSEDDTPKKSVKTVKYKKASRTRKSTCGNEICTICLEEFQNDEEIKLAQCNHGYHKDCLANWLTVKSNCPMCQTRLRNDDFDEHEPLLRSYRIDV